MAVVVVIAAADGSVGVLVVVVVVIEVVCGRGRAWGGALLCVVALLCVLTLTLCEERAAIAAGCEVRLRPQTMIPWGGGPRSAACQVGAPRRLSGASRRTTARPLPLKS